MPDPGWAHPMLFHAFLGFALGSAGAEAHRGKWSGGQGCFSTWRMPSESAALAHGQCGCHWPTHRAVSAGMGQRGGHPSAPTRSASKPMVILHLLVGPAVFCFCILGFFLPPVQPISVLHPLWPQSYCNSNPYPRPWDLWSLYRHKAATSTKQLLSANVFIQLLWKYKGRKTLNKCSSCSNLQFGELSYFMHPLQSALPLKQWICMHRLTHVKLPTALALITYSIFVQA